MLTVLVNQRISFIAIDFKFALVDPHEFLEQIESETAQFFFWLGRGATLKCPAQATSGCQLFGTRIAAQEITHFSRDPLATVHD